MGVGVGVECWLLGVGVGCCLSEMFPWSLVGVAAET